MEKKFGKNQEFKLLRKFSEEKDTYTRYFYECECIKCGTERLLSQSDANTGVCLECRKQKTINSVVGKTINIYNVLEFSHKKNTLNFYRCECLKCKTISVVHATGLQNNKNCKGCKKYGSEPTEQAQFNFVLDQYKRGAQKRDLEFKLTNEQFKKLILGNCHYCKSQPEPKKYKNRKNTIKTISYNGIDRVDSSLGYNEKNCISCCEMCNRMKMAYGQKEFLEQIKKIYDNLLKNR